ncbi:1-phosphatidylinositol-4-phosphate 5-kinase [Kwoniella mangroviensis CBS 8886]|uniref:uncharacterized protein n=1 Tax=Kwoniella mangroviensis CBS 8507 TaxID=1296122 RepID=UPI00080D21E3|nr:1-phosphatidylinositol-4-phosphate 5-kinase [Kwoniella mangroviensis CBS 8507]OCF69583.1 1-phosphatidylinositol-4-phosphate 5-kinase [Kwoniella mangroviensis CBS 8507]OCF70961.1 1-phosphatidylinositol-4-phosphate 5-kinase [Kwoniella mangroviensis CBS 8886]
MAETATYDPHHPLSHPKAAFTNHIGQPAAEGSRDARIREREAQQQSNTWQQPSNNYVGPNGSEDIQMDDHFEAVKLNGSASPRINPFHLLSHPNSTSPLPPLPPHLQALTTELHPDESQQQYFQSINPDNSSISAPVHITKVTPTTVEVTSHTPEGTHKRVIKKISSVFKRESNDTISPPGGRSPVMQGPPPSPPISENGDSVFASETTDTLDHLDQHQPNQDEILLSPVDEVPDNNNGVLPPTDSPSIANTFTTEPIDLGGSPTSLAPPVLSATRRVSSGSATSSRAGSLTIVRSGRLAPQRDQPETSTSASASASTSTSNGNIGLGLSKNLPDLPTDQERRGSDGSILSAPKPTRRSTNPSPVVPSSPRSPLPHSHSHFSPSLLPQNSMTPIPGLEGAALASDILAQTELLRQKRMEKRQKKASAQSQNQTQGGTTQVEGDVAQENEAQQSPPQQVSQQPSSRAEERPKDPETKVLVGNLIGEDHVNYVLMYNMLTGIRIGVSRCQAKIKRPLTDEDYVARHKFSFDIVGNELTPSAKYDFKFKDYAPWIFRDLRDEHFHLDPADYLLSLTAKYILSELGSPGKSGSFFYFSRDYRFIIKTISHAEHKFLRSILKDYHQHIKTNPHTLLSRFYGLHRVKLPRGRKIHFVIMNNLFPPHRDIHETYDLKGSAFGREYPEDKARQNPKAVLKDKNWVNRGRTLELGPEKRALLSEQLRRDMEFLKRVKVMDYSLLVGIHNMERGNRDNLRENQLQMFHPEVPPPRRKPSAIKQSNEASNVRKAVRRSDPKMLDVTSQLPSSDSADRRHFLFYQDEGGLRATDEANQNMDVIYYLGIIDICTPYNSLKKIEHFWKSMTEDRHTISCIEPVTYGQRFLNFLSSVMRGGDKSLRPLGLEAPSRAEEEEQPVGEVTQNQTHVPNQSESQAINASPVDVEKQHHPRVRSESQLSQVSLNSNVHKSQPELPQSNAQQPQLNGGASGDRAPECEKEANDIDDERGINPIARDVEKNGVEFVVSS